MTAPGPEPDLPEQTEPAAGNGDAPTRPDSGQAGGSAESESTRDSADNLANQTVINNFYREVATGSIGFSGSDGQFVRPTVSRDTGLVAVARIDNELRHYLRPNSFTGAMEILTTRHLVVLAGPEGCGKRAGSLKLARLACPEAESFTVFPPTRSLSELSAYKSYRPGQAYLVHDWMPVSADSKSAASFDLEQLIDKLISAQAYMVITFEGAGQLQVTFGDICILWSPPDPGELLERCSDQVPGLRLTDEERGQLKERANDLRSPRLIIKLAMAASAGVAGALAEVSETENKGIADWFDSRPARWKVWAVVALTFLSGVGERRFERLLTALTDSQTASDPPAAETGPHTEREDDPFPQSRWKLAHDASLGAFLSERSPSAPVGAEYRPEFRTKDYRLHFMMEMNRRFGDELWAPVRDWLFALADQPFGEAQIAAGYGLALLSRSALQEVEATYLVPWSAGNLKNRLMAVTVLWSMAEDDTVAPSALRIAVSWVRNRGQGRAITAALAFGGPLGQRYPSEAMRWLWVLAQRSERISLIACTAIGQLFAVETEAALEKSAVIRFILQKVRLVLKEQTTVHDRRSTLAVANSVLDTRQNLSEVPVVASVLRSRPADFKPVGELWAAVLDSGPHRREAVKSLRRTLTTFTDGSDSVKMAADLGAAILPRLTDRTVQILQQALPDPEWAEEASAKVVAAFLGSL